MNFEKMEKPQQGAEMEASALLRDFDNFFTKIEPGSRQEENVIQALNMIDFDTENLSLARKKLRKMVEEVYAKLKKARAAKKI